MKPKSGVFCFLIKEARETTALEMPDRENTFVLKADNSMEYVIEATSSNDMKSWLSIIKYSMRDPNNSATIERQQQQQQSINGNSQSSNNNTPRITSLGVRVVDDGLVRPPLDPIEDFPIPGEINVTGAVMNDAPLLPPRFLQQGKDRPSGTRFIELSISVLYPFKVLITRRATVAVLGLHSSSSNSLTCVLALAMEM